MVGSEADAQSTAERRSGQFHSNEGQEHRTVPEIEVSEDNHIVENQLEEDSATLEILPTMIAQMLTSDSNAVLTEKRLTADPQTVVIRINDLTSIVNVGCCSQHIVRLSRHIGLLYTAKTVQICCNQLRSIPAEIGYLTHLTFLSLSNNSLSELPETIGLLTNLVELKLNNNRLTTLPSSIGTLRKLVELTVSHNAIESLPHEIGKLSSLMSLNVSHNPLTVVPAELAMIKNLRRIRVDECPLTTLPSNGPSKLPSLKELAARTIVRLQLPILNITQSDIKDYLASAQQCTFCGGPFFETHVPHIRLVQHGARLLPLYYRLCIRHWSNDTERIASLFAPRPSTAPSPIPSTLNTPMATPPDSPHLNRSTRLSIPLSSISKSPSLPSLSDVFDDHPSVNTRNSASRFQRSISFLFH